MCDVVDGNGTQGTFVQRHCAFFAAHTVTTVKKHGGNEVIETYFTFKHTAHFGIIFRLVLQ